VIGAETVQVDPRSGCWPPPPRPSARALARAVEVVVRSFKGQRSSWSLFANELRSLKIAPEGNQREPPLIARRFTDFACSSSHKWDEVRVCNHGHGASARLLVDGCGRGMRLSELHNVSATRRCSRAFVCFRTPSTRTCDRPIAMQQTAQTTAPVASQHASNVAYCFLHSTCKARDRCSHTYLLIRPMKGRCSSAHHMSSWCATPRATPPPLPCTSTQLLLWLVSVPTEHQPCRAGQPHGVSHHAVERH
jgi:hypothetical protein